MKYRRFKDIVLIHGDCFKLIQKLCKVDAVITDPPYNYEFLNFDWDSGKIKSGLDANLKSNAKIKHVPKHNKLGGLRNTKWYDNLKKRDLLFETSCLEFCSLIHQTLKPGAFFLQFSDSKSTGIVGHAHRQFFQVKDILVWDRNSGPARGRPGSRDGIDVPNLNTVIINRWGINYS